MICRLPGLSVGRYLMDTELSGSERENTANKSAEVADHEFGVFFTFSPKHSLGT